MIPIEFEYIKRAVQAIESGTLTPREEVKVLRTVAQITEKSAKEKELELLDILGS